MPRKQLLTRTSMSRAASPLEGARLHQVAKRVEDFVDVLLPSQFFTSSRASHAFWCGEQRLLFAVLQDAVLYWFRFCERRTPRERRLFAETYAWFWSQERGRLFAFERICELLDLDADYIRRGLLFWERTTPSRDAVAAGVRRTLSSQ